MIRSPDTGEASITTRWHGDDGVLVEIDCETKVVSLVLSKKQRDRLVYDLMNPKQAAAPKRRPGDTA